MAKIVNLAVPVWSHDHQRTLMPVENPLTVRDAVADYWKGEGLLEGDPIAVAAETETDAEDEVPAKARRRATS